MTDTAPDPLDEARLRVTASHRLLEAVDHEHVPEAQALESLEVPGRTGEMVAPRRTEAGRMSGGVIPAAFAWRTNAALIADVARLGYITGHVLDPTWGRGLFWTKFEPERLTRHDLLLDGIDFRDLPYPDGTFETVVYDPPYKLNGTPALGDHDNRYGVDVPATWQGRMRSILEGAAECARVVAPTGHLLVKVMDQVCSGEIRWQTDEVTKTVEPRGFRKIDRLDFLGGGRPQPPGRRQLHAHSRPSSLLVFRKATI